MATSDDYARCEACGAAATHALDGSDSGAPLHRYCATHTALEFERLGRMGSDARITVRPLHASDAASGTEAFEPALDERAVRRGGAGDSDNSA